MEYPVLIVVQTEKNDMSHVVNFRSEPAVRAAEAVLREMDGRNGVYYVVTRLFS